MAAIRRPLSSALSGAVRSPSSRRALSTTRPLRAGADPSSSASTEGEKKTSTNYAPAASGGDSAMIRQEDAAEGAPKHQPDYNVAVDYRTSTFSPIPKRVMDGSEPGPSVSAAVLSGAPVDLQARRVRIYAPAKTATQSGDWHSSKWVMDWDPLSKGYRWENPLMGWQSSADFMNGVQVGFKTKEDAIQFANKQGYEYFVQEPNARRIVPKAYANNFMHSPGKLKVVRTK